LGRRAIATGYNDPEDDEADRIYAEIDEKMAERRRSRREKNEEEEEKRQEALRPKTQLIFADLKRDLSRVSEAEWAALPEVGDFRIKRLKRSGAIENPKERFLPVPDSVHKSLINQTTGIVQDGGEEEEADFLKIGEARGKLLGMHLDQISKPTTSNSEQVDTVAIASEEKLAEIGDLKRARQLFALIIKSNRKNPAGWISAARLEFQAGNQKQARALIMKATEECGKSEEVWTEAIKLHEDNENAKEILAKALRSVPTAISLWLLAGEKETEISAKRKILRAALERNSTSSKLWIALVELEESEDDARLLLTRAVECASESVELWLALARLQGSTSQARQVLNRARLACPKSFAIWINAARLEESNDTSATEIRKLLSRGATELSAQGVELTWNDWQREAEECEMGGDLICAAELISIGVDLTLTIDPEIKKSIIVYAGDTEYLTCAKSALSAILEKENTCKEAILLLIKILRTEESFDELRRIYERAVEINTSADLWISYARDFRTESRDILNRAVQVITKESDQIKIWKEAIILEIPNFRRNPQSIENFCANIPQNSPDLMVEIMRVYLVIGMKSRAIDIARTCIEKFPKEAEFWLCMAQSDVSILKSGLEQNPTSVKLALRIAELEAADVQVLLEKTRLAIQKSKTQIDGYDRLLVAICILNCPETCITSVLPSKFNPLPRVKPIPNANIQSAKLILNQSLKEEPKSALLWYLAVCLEPRQLRRSKVTEALRRFENKTDKVEEEAILRWTLAVLLDEKAKEQELNKAVDLDPLNMDLQAFLGAERVSKETGNVLGETRGNNWLKFIKENNFYYESISESFDKFKEALFEN
jgi:pre-mRNA-processing factor 6